MEQKCNNDEIEKEMNPPNKENADKMNVMKENKPSETDGFVKVSDVVKDEKNEKDKDKDQNSKISGVKRKQNEDKTVEETENGNAGPPSKKQRTE